MQHLFEQILAADNFLIFKSMMVQKNIDLELQALSLLQRQLGYSPNAYRPGDPEEDFLRGKTAGGEDDALLEEALKQSKEEFDLQQSLDEEETARLLEMAKAESLRLYQAQQREQEELAGQLEKALQASGPGPVPASDSGIAKGLESARLRSETAPSRSEVSKKPEQEPGELSTATPRAPDAQGGTVEELAAENSTHRILRKPEDHRSNEPSPAIGGVSPKHSHLPPSQSPAREQRQQESPKPPSLGGLPLAGGGQIKEVGESPSAGGGQIKEVGESTLAGGGQIKEVGRAPSAGGGQIIKVGGSPSAGGGQIKEVGESPSAGGEQFEEVGRSPSAGRGQIKEVGRSPSAGGGQIKEVGKSPSAGGGQTKEVGRSPSAGGGQTKEVGRSPSAGGGQTKEVGRSPSAGGGQTKEVGISPSAGGGQTKEVGKSPSAGGGQTKEVGKSPSAVGGGGEGRMKEVSGVEAAARWIESAKADVQRGVPGGSYSHGIQASDSINITQSIAITLTAVAMLRMYKWEVCIYRTPLKWTPLLKDTSVLRTCLNLPLK